MSSILGLYSFKMSAIRLPALEIGQRKRYIFLEHELYGECASLESAAYIFAWQHISHNFNAECHKWYS